MENFNNISKFIKENDLDLLSDVSDDLICIICKGIMINATSAPCRCRYCYECIKKYLKGKRKLSCPGSGKYCKLDKLRFEQDIQVDNTINNRISKLIVKCPQKSCEFKCELCLIKDHIEICDKRSVDCPYLQLGCNKEDVQLNNMKPHLYDDSFIHNKLLIEYINNFKNDVEILKNNMKTMEDENIKLKEQITYKNLNAERKEVALNEIIERIQNENKNMKEEINVLLTENKAKHNLLMGINENLKKIIDSTEIKQKKFKERIAILNCESEIIKGNLFYVMSEVKSIQTNNKIQFNKIDENNEKMRRLLAQKSEEIKMSINNIENKNQIKCNQITEMLNSDNELIRDKITSLVSEVEIIKSARDIDNLKMKCDKVYENITKLNEKAAILVTENETMKDKIDILQSVQDKDDLRMKCNQIEENQKEIEKKIETLNEITEMDSINDDLDTIRYDVMRIEGNVDSIKEKVDYLKSTLKMKGFIWKIENLSKKIDSSQNKTSRFIYSDSFETHLNGYRICLYACPNGFKRSKGYFGVFFKLMMGPYDDILSWPCKLNITIQLIYQDSGAAFLTREKKYENNSDNEFYQKPLDINSKGFGYSRLIKLDDLLKQTDLIQNNQLHIKCITNVLD